MYERTQQRVRPTFSEALQGLNSAQKSGDGVPAYMRFVNRRLARVPAALGASWGMTPNQMTAASALASAAGIVLIAFGPVTPLVGLCAGLLLVLGFVLDSADGQLARVTGRGGGAGEWVDHVVDAVRSPAVHAAILIGWWRGALVGPTWMLLIPICYQLIVTGQFLSQILAEQIQRQRHGGSTPAEPASKKKSLLRSLMLLPVDSGTLFIILCFWGFPQLFEGLYIALIITSLPIIAVSVARKYRALNQQGDS